MKRFLFILTIVSVLATGCTTISDKNPNVTPDSEQAQGTETPYSNGPTEGPDSIKGPDTPPPTPEEEAAEVARTHQIIETSYTDSDGVHKITLTFNIDKDKVEGIMLQPAFHEEPGKSYSSFLAEQVVFKNINEINVTPHTDAPEFSQAYIDAFSKAVEMYREKNPS